MAIEHRIRPERMDRFTVQPDGLVIEKPDGSRFKVEKGNDGQNKLVEIEKK